MFTQTNRAFFFGVQWRICELLLKIWVSLNLEIPVETISLKSWAEWGPTEEHSSSEPHLYLTVPPTVPLLFCFRTGQNSGTRFSAGSQVPLHH